MIFHLMLIITGVRVVVAVAVAGKVGAPYSFAKVVIIASPPPPAPFENSCILFQPLTNMSERGAYIFIYI